MGARPVGSWVLQSNNVVAEGLAVSLDKPLEWASGTGVRHIDAPLTPERVWRAVGGSG